MQPGRCRMCGQSTDEVQFSNSQRKRLKKGQAATCKACSSSADSSCSAAPSVVIGARPSPDGAKDVTASTSSKVSMVSGKVVGAVQCGATYFFCAYGRKFGLHIHTSICVNQALRHIFFRLIFCLVCAYTPQFASTNHFTPPARYEL